MIPRKSLFCLVLVALLAFPLTGVCQDILRVSAYAGERMKGIKRVGIVLVDVNMYEVLAGGVREARSRWTEAAKQNLGVSLEAQLKGRSIEAKVVREGAESEDLDEAAVLYLAVREAILLHSYDFFRGLYFFPAKAGDLDYSIGPIQDLLSRLQVDGLLFVTVRDYISSGGRKAMMVVGALAGIAFTPGLMWANMALVDGSGSVLWFCRNNFAHDPREPAEASQLVGELLNQLPVPRQ